MTYAILINPGHNRVYFETSFSLSAPEFNIAAQKMSAACTGARHQKLFGADYLTFNADGRLTDADVEIIAGLSFTYALFMVEALDGGGPCFTPIDITRDHFVDNSISSILKYTGKTNEVFTRMLINIAYYSQNNTEGIKLLDPVAGKGTTLYEGLIKGFDSYGVEIGDKAVREAYHYLKKYFESARYKFEQGVLRVSGPGRSFTAQKYTFKAAHTKDDFKAGRVKDAELIAGNSMYANKFYKKDYFDIIVGDLPYGVQHGNVTNEKQSSLTRNPAELLGACLPAWLDVLKPGGAIVLAWNSNVLPRKKMEQIFAARGLSILDGDDYLRLGHRVDQSIYRDVIAAHK